MLKILSVNTGKTSIKFSLFNMDDSSVICDGIFDRIGMDKSYYNINFNNNTVSQDVILNTINDTVDILLDKLLSLGIITNLNEIRGVGHRVVHGANKYNEAILIDDNFIEEFLNLKDYAPLHNPYHLEGIKAFRENLDDIVHIAVFDTAFHQTMTEEKYIYPIPYDWYLKYGVRKYGAHGISHKYISKEVSKILNKDEYKLISCHLGNGASICAVKNGKSIDTSMGFTPLAGVMMGTRSGDIDPSIIPFVMEKEGKNASEIIHDLNSISGLLGLSMSSSDMRDIVKKADEGDKNAILAKNKYVRRVVDYISSYYVLLGGVDIIVFTAGIGEFNKTIRREISEQLSCLGISINLDLNQKVGEITKISSDDSKVLIYVIPTNEELEIAREVVKFI